MHIIIAVSATLCFIVHAVSGLSMSLSGNVVYDASHVRAILKSQQTNNTSSSKQIITCCTFGFSSWLGRIYYNGLFNEELVASLSNNDNSNALNLIVNADQPKEIYAVNGGDLCVGFIHQLQLVGDESKILAFVQAFIDGVASSNAGATSKLILIYKGEKTSQLEKLEKLVQELIISKENVRRNIEVEIFHLGNDVTLSPATSASAISNPVQKTENDILSYVRSIIVDTLANNSIINNDRLNDRLLDQLASINATLVRAGHVNANIEEIQATIACNKLLESFISKLTNKLGSCNRIKSIKSYNSTLNQLSDAILSTIRENYDDNRLLFEKYSQSRTMQIISNQAHKSLQLLLQPFFIKLIDLLQSATMDSFIQQYIPRAPGNSNLPELLKVFFGAANSGFLCAYSDVAPNFSSSITSLGNTVAAIAGICGPLVIGWIEEWMPGIWGWRIAFFLTFGMCLFSIILWLAIMKIEINPILNTPLPLLPPRPRDTSRKGKQ
eukprot:gene4291-6084_t